MGKLSGNSISPSDLFLMPNLITLFRLILAVPLFWALNDHNLILVTIIIIIGIASDFLDGIAARKRNEITELGKILDPLADKFFIGLSAVSLMNNYHFPLWLGYSIIIRDILIVIGSLLLVGKIKKINPSNMIGKLTVNVVAICIISYIYGITLLIPVFTWLSYLFIVISFISYVIIGIGKLRK